MLRTSFIKFSMHYSSQEARFFMCSSMGHKKLSSKKYLPFEPEIWICAIAGVLLDKDLLVATSSQKFLKTKFLKSNNTACLARVITYRKTTHYFQHCTIKSHDQIIWSILMIQSVNFTSVVNNCMKELW